MNYICDRCHDKLEKPRRCKGNKGQNLCDKCRLIKLYFQRKAYRLRKKYEKRNM